MVTMKYTEVMNMPFSQAMQGLTAAKVHGNVASQIHTVAKQVEKARKQVMKEYQTDIGEKFGKKDKDGKLIRPAGEPNGFEPDEEQADAMDGAMRTFDERFVELNCKPFTLQLFGDIKISAQDLKALAGLYVGNAEEPEAKPEMPENVTSLASSLR